jgi:hypothetical protein
MLPTPGPSPFRILRLWNSEVFGNFDGIPERIGSSLRDPHPCPLPSRERGKGGERQGQDE